MLFAFAFSDDWLVKSLLKAYIVIYVLTRSKKFLYCMTRFRELSLEIELELILLPIAYGPSPTSCKHSYEIVFLIITGQLIT